MVSVNVEGNGAMGDQHGKLGANRPSMTRRGLIAAATTGYAALVTKPRARAASAGLRIGVLTDMSGYSADVSGIGSVLAARMAAETFGGTSCGGPIQVLAGDHQNKADIGAAVARQWCASGVDVVVNVNNSAVALAVNEITRQENKILLATGPGTTRLTGDACSPNTVHWSFDNYALAHGTATAVVRAGGDTWSFLTADFAFGIDLEAQAARVVEARHGRVLSRVRVPSQSADFSSYLLQVQSSRSKVIGFAMTAGDLQNAVKQAVEFGMADGGQQLACLLAFITDIHGLGLQVAQGLRLTEGFYWNLNPATRAWSLRFAERQRAGARPTMTQAGDYAAVLHTLKAIEQLGTSTDGAAVVAGMKVMPTDDPLFGQGTIRADGRKLHDMHLFQVKTPSESAEPWDYYKVLATIPAAEAFRPLEEGNCPMIGHT